MPTENTKPATELGALIAPLGSGAALSAEEYTILSGCLQALHGPDRQLVLVAEAFSYIYTRPTSKQTFGEFMTWLLMELLDDGGQADGMLVTGAWDEPVLLIDICGEEGRAEVLANLLKILRTKSWFAKWLELEINNFADGSNGTPTPLFLMGTLTDELAIFESQLESARNVRRQYPHMFKESEAPIPTSPSSE